MTNELQLARAAGLSTNAQDMGPGYTTSQQNHTPKPMGLKKVHRLLRGRYPLVVALALLFGIAGGILGFNSQKPMFQSETRLQISPYMPNLGNEDSYMPGFGSFLQDQAMLIQNPEMIRRAMQEADWKTVSAVPLTEDAINSFSNNLDAEAVAGTSQIRISYSDPNPKIAYAGALAMWEAYNAYYSERDASGLNAKMRLLEQKKRDLETTLSSLHQQLANVSPLGPDNLGAMQANEIASLVQLRQRKLDADREVIASQEAADHAGGANTADKKAVGDALTPLTAEQIQAMGDQRMQTLLNKKQDLEDTINLNARRGILPDNPLMLRSSDELDIVKAQISDYVGSVNRNYRAGTNRSGRPGDPLAPVNFQADLAAKKIQAEAAKKDVEDATADIQDLAGKIRTVNDLKSQIETKQNELNVLDQQYDNHDAQQKLMAGQMTAVSLPAMATQPSTDKRRQVAVAGFLGGALLPVCVILLISLLDGRFRFSDETNTDLGGVPLLGILPNLPDLLTDPEQAATAAHCVHQIRTILQITGAATESTAFAITSGSPGDGKTSLALALGLSFAASGSRTLLIDADLVGCGLTARLNVDQPHGVLEAMASRDILPYVRTTDVANLSILPVGQMMGGYTGTIAPAAVRRLVNEAKKNFDIVVIDTGPILGSIEASPVAVACDGVVLCVSRGQQQQLVHRAVAHLQSIGAKFAGAVFNRAQTHDFERSVSRMSMKPLPNPNASQGNGYGSTERIGPVAKAVASSVRPSNGSGGNHNS
ncbi:MAG: AAA family ATPase [Planctomycetota bacterium]|nr:AAA family ATPase [Planctomycetota bacterium]